MRHVPGLIASFFLGGCVSSSPTTVSILSGDPAVLAHPGCVLVVSGAGNLSTSARELMQSALYKAGLPAEQPCTGQEPHARVVVNVSDSVVTTHGVMPGQLSVEAHLELAGVRPSGTRLWLLRTDAYYLKPEVEALAETIAYVIKHGTVPPGARLLPRS